MRRVLLYIISLLIFFLVIAMIALNLMLERAFRKQVDSFNRITEYTISFDDFETSIFSGSAVLNGFYLRYDRAVGAKQPHFKVARVELKNLKVFELLLHKRLIIEKFEVDDLDILILPVDLANSSKTDSSAEEETEKGDDFNEFRLDRFVIDSFNVLIAGNSVSDTISHISGGRFELGGIDIYRDESSELGYSYQDKDLVLSMEDQSVELINLKRKLTFERFQYAVRDRTFEFEHLAMITLPDIESAMRSSRFTSTFLNAAAERVTAHGFEFGNKWDLSDWKMDSLLIVSPVLELVKDQTKPFDQNKRIPLPPQALRADSTRYHIERIRLSDGRLTYTEKHEKGEMQVPMTHLNASIANLGTFYPESSGKELYIHLEATLFDDLPFNIDLSYKDPLGSDSFSFKGQTGSTSMRSFSRVVQHTISTRFTGGILDSIYFNGNGNNHHANGELTMLYHGLEAELLRDDEQTRNRLLTFLSKQFIQDNNPHRGRTRVANMSFERVPYKGLGNYLFKTILSGIINTFNPVSGKAR